MKRLLSFAVFLALIVAVTRAQVAYTGSGYVQNFGTLAPAPNNSIGQRWTDNVTLPGWYADRTTYGITNGTLGGTAADFDDTTVAANAGLFSFGSSGSTDRALGLRSPTGGAVNYGLRLVNRTGRTLTRFSVAYTGEQWFKSSATTAHTLTVEYQVGARDLVLGPWSPVPALTFTSPILTPAAAAALNGNTAANRAARVATITGVSWAPGQELWLRFSDTDEAGPEHGLAIDDFAFWTGDDEALFFNGATSYVTMGRAPELGLSVFTLECWFFQTGLGASANTGTGGVTAVPLVTKGRGEADGSNLDCNYFLGLDADGHLVADFEAAPAPGITAGQNYPIIGRRSANPGTWNHAAVSYDGTTWRIYLNGELDTTSTPPTGASPRADSIQHFGIGTAMTSTGATAGFFQGVIDEVRVWRTARTPAEILATRDLSVAAATAGLVARYALDEGAGNTVTSAVPGVPAGTLTGAPTWTTGRRLVANVAPTVALTSPTAAYTGMFPATVPLAATANDPDGAVLKVEFFADGTKIGESSAAPFAFDWLRVPAGTYALTAVATDNSGTRTTSAPVTITVAQNPNRPVTVVLAGPAAGATGLGVSTTLTATVTDPERAATRVTFFGRRTAPAAPGPDFTVGTLPDTQYYSENIDGRSAHFFAQTQWYADNRDVLNLAFVSHMGDIVQNGDLIGTPAQDNTAEWIIADAAMRRIEDRVATLRAYGIPWGAAPGNHDQSPIGDAGGTTRFYNQYFGVERFAGRPYFGGRYGTNNNNNYQLFSASGLDFIILHLEYDTRALSFYQPVLEWADAVLKAHPHRRAIVTSHWIVNTGFPATFSTQGRAIYDHLKSNPNLFLMLCGHVAGEGRRTDVFEGRAVHSVLQDYQGRVNGGDGWLRTFTFSPARNTVTARTYSPSLVRAELDADSDFTLPYDMMGAVTDWISLGTIDLPAGATTATLSWTGLDRGADFEWRAEVRDEINTTVSASRRFTTAAAVPPAVELVAPAAGARIPIPATVRLAANVTSARPIARVEFYRDNTKLGETRAAPYEFTWSNPAPGPYTLSAIAIDDTGAFTLSRLVDVTIFNASSAPPQVALTSPPADASALPGATLMLAATATDRDGTIVLVEFFNGAEKIGESRAAPFGFAWAPPVGNHTLTARATDIDGQSAISAPVAVAVRDSAPGRVINFSVLAGVGPGNAAIIVGFVSGGVGTSGTKPLLVRALGPALAAFGVPGVTADSLAELYTGSAIVASNDNWAGNPAVVATAAAVGAFPLADPGSRDAAFSATRPVGAHTIVVTGASGLALAELYDATPAASFTAATPRLLNVSARALVAPGSDSVHAGLVIGGTAARTLLIRAIGPGLAAFGVTNALADPRLELFRTGSAAPIAANDDWAANPVITNAGGKAGAFALIPTSRDAAVLVTLAPGSYTLRVSAPTAATGAALIDVYEVP